MNKGRRPGIHTPQKRKYYKGYYPPGEAAKILGVSRERLYTYISNGRLERRIPPGKKQGLLLKEQVDGLARELRNFAKVPGPAARFVKATPDDMDAAGKLIEQLFNHAPNVPRWKQYLANNPDCGYLMKTDTGLVLACGFFMPLPLERIEEMFSYEETHTPSIMPDEIKPFIPGEAYHLYVRAVGVSPALSREQKRIYGAMLIRGMREAIIELGSRGIDIKTIQSRSQTRDGISVMRAMGFTEVESATASRQFLIEVERSGIPEIMKYKQALAKWKQEHTSSVS